VILGIAVAALLALALGAFLRRPSLSRPPFLPRDRADATRLERDVRVLTTDLLPRAADDPQSLERTAAYIETALRAATSRVDSQRYTVRGAEFRNVIATFGPADGPAIVVGAHYDAMGLFGSNPGADDNASGTAGLLELARLLRAVDLRRRVDLVAYTLEEPPFFATPQMGSRVHAASLAASGRSIDAMIGFEMIGCFTERQPWPSALLALVYPRRGDFIGVVGQPRDHGLARRVKGWMRIPGGVPVYSFNGPTMMGTDASDHASYWHHGMPAVMVTDTAFMRNPRYHTAADTADTLDYRRMALVVDGVLNAVLHLAAAPPPAPDRARSAPPA
jgi:Zn-dependent M28 family amino/carboxypeptidase